MDGNEREHMQSFSASTFITSITVAKYYFLYYSVPMVILMFRNSSEQRSLIHSFTCDTQFAERFPNSGRFQNVSGKNVI